MVALSTLLAASCIETDIQFDVSVTSVVQHTDQVQKGSLFFAFEGLHSSGTRWAAEAARKGAVAIVAEKSIEDLDLPVIVVKKIRSVYSTMCAAFWGNPERDLTLIGVTGTDGKSTTCDYLYQILGFHNVQSGLLSTISVDDGSGKIESPWRQSTPEAELLFAFLARCRDNGLSTVVLECTSHALSESFDRLGPITFDIATVTTVSSEHLDFHGDKDAYLTAKLRIIERLKLTGFFISSIENAVLPTFLSALKKTQHPLVAGKQIPYQVQDNGWDGVTLLVGQSTIETSVLLPALATNSLLAHLCVQALLGKELDLLPLGSLGPVKGRMQLIPNTLGVVACIDFAHTADAYDKVFGFAKAHTPGRIIAVLGAAGERDRTKRPAMGRIASEAADLIFLTEEDPRSEDPEQVFDDLRSQMNGRCDVVIIGDRKSAIEEAIGRSQVGDTLLFLGKGHEQTILRNDGPVPWDEIAVVQTALNEEERRRCE
jgi:UDP-N-acetylmuramoyl-L-alanyl-D-glutamate--2,6-diaminopimelate ligase